MYDEPSIRLTHSENTIKRPQRGHERASQRIPSSGLFYANRQVRAEFRSIWMRSTEHSIVVQDLAEYLTTWLEVLDHDLDKKVPGKLRIVIQYCYNCYRDKMWSSGEYNILPLLKIKAFIPSFQIKFSRHCCSSLADYGPAPCFSLGGFQTPYSEMVEVVDREVQALNTLLDNKNPRWRKLVKDAQMLCIFNRRSEHWSNRICARISRKRAGAGLEVMQTCM